MTELPGRPEWAASQRWMRQLVDVLVDVHDIDPVAASAVRPFNTYSPASYALPKWVTKPAVWERAIQIFHGPVLDDDRTSIHRDFYPGNVLWHPRTVSGVVDWEAASVGPRFDGRRPLPDQPALRRTRHRRHLHPDLGVVHSTIS